MAKAKILWFLPFLSVVTPVLACPDGCTCDTSGRVTSVTNTQAFNAWVSSNPSAAASLSFGAGSLSPSSQASAISGVQNHGTIGGGGGASIHQDGPGTFSSFAFLEGPVATSPQGVVVRGQGACRAPETTTTVMTDAKTAAGGFDFLKFTKSIQRQVQTITVYTPTKKWGEIEKGTTSCLEWEGGILEDPGRGEDKPACISVVRTFLVGCGDDMPPPPAPAKQIFGEVSLGADTLFDFNKDVLRPEGRERLDQLVTQLDGVTVQSLLVIGHTDRVDTEAYNLDLSRRRANTVRAYLVAKGIDGGKVHAIGRGEAEPVTGEQCRRMGEESYRNAKLVECLQPDRRVVVRVVGLKEMAPVDKK